MTSVNNPKSEEWTLLKFGAEIAGPDLWRRYCTAIFNSYKVLDGTPLALNSEDKALCKRWKGLRNAPQSFYYTPFLEQIEEFEAQIISLIRESLKSGEFVAIGFVGAEEREVPPRLFRDNALCIWLGQSEVEFPDGTVFRSIIVNRRGPSLPIENKFMPTGAPGRPSKGMHLIREEFNRRQKTKQRKLTLREEAIQLEDWFRSSYPNRPPVSFKTIENNIRSDYRNWRENQPPIDS